MSFSSTELIVLALFDTIFQISFPVTQKENVNPFVNFRHSSLSTFQQHPVNMRSISGLLHKKSVHRTNGFKATRRFHCKLALVHALSI